MWLKFWCCKRVISIDEFEVLIKSWNRPKCSFSVWVHCPGSASLNNLKRFSFCLFVVVSPSLWRWMGWELPGYFRLIFHICVTRFDNSATHEISVTIGFILKELIPRFRSWLWHHRLPNVTTTEAQPRLWWHLGVCGVTAMTENEVSISILSWYHKINFKLGVLAKPNCFSVAQV